MEVARAERGERRGRWERRNRENNSERGVGYVLKGTIVLSKTGKNKKICQMVKFRTRFKLGQET